MGAAKQQTDERLCFVHRPTPLLRAQHVTEGLTGRLQNEGEQTLLRVKAGRQWVVRSLPRVKPKQEVGPSVVRDEPLTRRRRLHNKGGDTHNLIPAGRTAYNDIKQNTSQTTVECELRLESKCH